MNLNILGLSSLVLAAKFCENDPIVPHLQYFIKIFNKVKVISINSKHEK